MITLDNGARSKPIPVPRKVAVCPICDADIVIEHIHEWECDNGKPLGIALECTTEPDIDSDEWEEWHYGHWSAPYVDWLSVEEKVLKWFQRHYRCGVSECG